VSGSDPLVALAALPGVAEAAAAARSAVDAVLWDRALRPRMTELAAESRLRGAWASAAIDGADVRPETVRSGAALDDSPIGRVVAAALRAQAETPRLTAIFERAPMQAWAALHAVTASGFSDELLLGRPRSDDAPDDPLRLGQAPSAAAATHRLESLSTLLLTPTAAPAVLLAAIAHAELLATRPFAGGSGLVARATTRLVLSVRGVDPDGVTVYEAGLLSLGRPAYAAAMRNYLTGSSHGVAEWLRFSCEAVGIGAAETRRAYEALPPV
jgi:Fic family protein